MSQMQSKLKVGMYPSSDEEWELSTYPIPYHPRARLRQRNMYPAVYPQPDVHSRIIVRLFGAARLPADHKNFERPTDIYLFRCHRHKIWAVDYLHGHDKYLNCPKCLPPRLKGKVQPLTLKVPN